MTEGDAASEISEVNPDLWRLGENGLLCSAVRAVGLVVDRERTARVGLVFALVTWLPLVVLTASDRQLLGGPTIPFAYSFGTHVRLLLAIPLFFLAESRFGRRSVEALKTLVRSDLVAAHDLERYQGAWRAADRLWSSWLVELALAALAIAAISAGLRADAPRGITTWRTLTSGGLSPAGWWYYGVSLPIFQFLFWRWGWWLLVWGRLLWQVSRLGLRIIPTHPDRAGGLGPLGVAHVELSPLVFAFSALAAGAIAEEVAFAGAAPAQFAAPFVGFIAGITVLSIAPLLFFASRLLRMKQQGLLEYGTLAARYTRDFEDKWLRGNAPRNESLLGTADLQSLADLGNSFGVIGEMRLLPVSPVQILILASSAAAPMLPLLLLAYPLDELVIRILRSLVGL